jgi:hypothetical protein
MSISSLKEHKICMVFQKTRGEGWKTFVQGGSKNTLDLSMHATDFSAFHYWLLAGGYRHAPSIVVVGSAESTRGTIVSLAAHLNEFDDLAGGRWTSFSHQLIQAIAQEPAQRKLLGIAPGVDCPQDEPASLKKIISALARRGHAILEGRDALEATLQLPDVFYAGLGPFEQDQGDYHVTLRRERFSHRCLPTIIGDTYLEWQATRDLAEVV